MEIRDKVVSKAQLTCWQRAAPDRPPSSFSSSSSSTDDEVKQAAAVAQDRRWLLGAHPSARTRTVPCEESGSARLDSAQLRVGFLA